MASGDKDHELAVAWLAMHYSDEGSESYLNNFGAYEELAKLITTSPNKALEVIDKILSIDDSDLIIANLAAGPVEDLLVEHGDDVIDTIVVKSRSKIVWRQLTNGIWRNAIKEHIWLKLQQS